MWFGTLAIALVVICFTEPKPGQSRTPLFFLLPGVAVFGYVLMSKLVFDLVDEVHDLGATLLVKNRGVDVQIPLRNIAHVGFCNATNPPRITLELSVPCEFGDKIVFIPTRKWTILSKGQEITNDLQRRIAIVR